MAATSAVPERTCVGCRTKRPQTQLVRWALSADGRPVISRTASGRGAWLCAENTPCLRQAIKRRGFDRAWKRSLDTTTQQTIENVFRASALDNVTTNMDN